MLTTKKATGGGRQSEKGGGTNSKRAGVKQEKFEGRTDGLAGYVFDTTTAQNANNYTNTLKEIARYVGSTLKSGADLRQTIKDQTLFVVARPTCPPALATGATTDKQVDYDVDMDIYCEDIKNFVKLKSTIEDNMGRAF